MEKIISFISAEVLKQDFSIYNSGEKCDLFLFENINAESFDKIVSYLKSLEGFTFVCDNKIENNLFYFCKVKETVVCAGYFPVNKTLRIVFDNNTYLPDIIKNDSGNNQTRFWQFEVDHKLIDCGMCYIMQTKTGDFFIIDSAHTYSINDCDRIYDFLRERTPNGKKIHIKGWFLSHGHEDHTAQFMNYVRYHMDDTELDMVYFNFISNDHRDGSDWMYSGKNYVNMLYSLMDEHPEIPVCRLHTGMYFYADNIRFDVLCSHEDVFPNDNSNYNDSSVTLMMQAEGTKVLFPGDAGGEESVLMETRYPGFLKSDIVQVAHHGHFGTSVEFYDLVDADVALFATTQIKFDEELPHYKANERAIELAKHVFIASNGTVEFPLPYKDGCFKVFPDETFESFQGVYNLWGYEYTLEHKKKLYEEYLSRGGKPLDEYKDML